jgi:ribosomal protein L32
MPKQIVPATELFARTMTLAAKCEHCGYAEAAKRWCMRCSSVDPFPTRRRLMVLLVGLLMAVGAFFVCTVPPQIAEREMSKIKATTRSFAAPR